MVRVVNDDVAIVENVDIFTPIHDDPYIQGEIVACNATNDIFAMGATDLLSLQAFLAYPKELPEEIVVGVLRGMKNFMERHEAKLSVARQSSTLFRFLEGLHSARHTPVILSIHMVPMSVMWSF